MKRREIPADLLELLTAVYEALDVPMAALGAEDAELFLWERRGGAARSVLGSWILADGHPGDRVYFLEAAAQLAEMTEADPVTYEVFPAADLAPFTGTGGAA